MSATDKAISHAIDKLRDEVTKSEKPIIVSFNGEMIEVSRKYVGALRDRENAHLAREARGTKKKTAVTPAQRDKTTAELTSKVDHSLQKAAGVKVSAALRKSIVEQVHHTLVHRKEDPKSTTFVPRLLYYIDDHFATFLNDIKLGLMARSMESRGNASLRKELTDLENAYTAYLRDKRVGASTVLNALVVLYTNTHDLRPKQKTGDSNSMIKMDARLKAFLKSPMNSMFQGDNLSKAYVATAETKKVGKGTSARTIQSLAGYRMQDGRRSVEDYLKATSSAEEVAQLNKGYIMGKHIMSLVSAHLIPASSFKTCDHAALSMVQSDGQYTNSNVYTLISLQAVITASHDDEVTAADVKARSPSRSPSRASGATPSRTPSREASRTPSRAQSRGRARAPSAK